MSGVYLILSRAAKMPLYGPGAQVVNPSIVRLDIKYYFTKANGSGYVVRSSDVIRACEDRKEEIKRNFLPNWGESPISFHFETLEEIIDGQTIVNAVLTIGESPILRTVFLGKYRGRPRKKLPDPND